jgi:hypothetical protein
LVILGGRTVFGLPARLPFESYNMKYSFDLREKTAMGIDEISRELNIPAGWLVEDAVQTLLSSYDDQIRLALEEGYAEHMRKAAEHDDFDKACRNAVKGLDVILDFEGTERYEAIAFKGKKIMRVSAKFPDLKIIPKEITLAESVEFVAACVADRESEFPDGGGDIEAEARWHCLIATALERGAR